MHISANDLKTKGVSAIEDGLGEIGEAIITVRGKERFVVMDVEHYNHLRECELEAAVHQARADVASGNVIVESVDEHIKRITDAI